MSRLDPRPLLWALAIWTRRGVGGVGDPVLTPTPWGVSGVFYCLIRADTAPSSEHGRPARARQDGRFWSQSSLRQRASLHPAARPHGLQ